MFYDIKQPEFAQAVYFILVVICHRLKTALYDKSASRVAIAVLCACKKQI
jgi:hypothetical protein